MKIILSFFLICLNPLATWFLALFSAVSSSIFGLDFFMLLGLTLIAVISSNYLGYFIGKKYSNNIKRYMINKNNYEKSLSWFNRFGNKTITLLALTPLPYFPILGGLFKMKLKEFTIFAIIPRIFHFLIFSLIILIIT